MTNTFHKQERLCSKKQIDLLFAKGKSQYAHPVKMIYLETPVDLPFPAQAMFVVPKRQFKRAHDRNALRRKIREAYRLGKGPMYEILRGHGIKILIAFIYVSKKSEDYEQIQKAVKKLTQRVAENSKLKN